MATRICRIAAALVAVILARAVLAQPFELTPAGKATLQTRFPAGSQLPNAGATTPTTFPLPNCMFPGGLCGAVHRDGSVAVPPYDWGGPYADGRAAVRILGPSVGCRPATAPLCGKIS